MFVRGLIIAGVSKVLSSFDMAGCFHLHRLSRTARVSKQAIIKPEVPQSPDARLS